MIGKLCKPPQSTLPDKGSARQIILEWEIPLLEYLSKGKLHSGYPTEDRSFSKICQRSASFPRFAKSPILKLCLATSMFFSPKYLPRRIKHGMGEVDGCLITTWKKPPRVSRDMELTETCAKVASFGRVSMSRFEASRFYLMSTHNFWLVKVKLTKIIKVSRLDLIFCQIHLEDRTQAEVNIIQKLERVWIGINQPTHKPSSNVSKCFVALRWRSIIWTFPLTRFA